MAKRRGSKQAFPAGLITSAMQKAGETAESAREKAEFDKQPFFWVVSALMALAAIVAKEVGGPILNTFVEIGEESYGIAGLSLAVAAISFVAACAAAWNLGRVMTGRKPETWEPPSWLKPYMAPVSAFAVGWLIGTTIFT